MVDEVFRGTSAINATDATTPLVDGLAGAPFGTFLLASHHTAVAAWKRVTDEERQSKVNAKKPANCRVRTGRDGDTLEFAGGSHGARTRAATRAIIVAA